MLYPLSYAHLSKYGGTRTRNLTITCSPHGIRPASFPFPTSSFIHPSDFIFETVPARSRTWSATFAGSSASTTLQGHLNEVDG